MKIWIKPYLRRDGSVMFFLNNDRKVSLGLTPENGYESSKASAGQKKLWETFCRATRESAALAEGADMTGHSEFKMTLFNGITFAMTDIATIGGVSVGSDGLFIVREGRVMAPQFRVED